MSGPGGAFSTGALAVARAVTARLPRSDAVRCSGERRRLPSWPVTARRSFVLSALALYTACALWATWPAIRHVDGHYLARPAAGHGQAAAGDHLQLGWAFWLVGHRLEDRESPLVDPYSFRPEAEAPPNLQGWLLGIPYWPLAAVASAYAAAIVRRRVRAALRRHRGQCIACGYDLRGSSATSDRCPECGTTCASRARLSCWEGV